MKERVRGDADSGESSDFVPSAKTSLPGSRERVVDVEVQSLSSMRADT